MNVWKHGANVQCEKGKNNRKFKIVETKDKAGYKVGFTEKMKKCQELTTTSNIFNPTVSTTGKKKKTSCL